VKKLRKHRSSILPSKATLVYLSPVRVGSKTIHVGELNGQPVSLMATTPGDKKKSRSAAGSTFKLVLLRKAGA